MADPLDRTLAAFGSLGLDPPTDEMSGISGSPRRR